MKNDKALQTISELRSKGYRVFVDHDRTHVFNHNGETPPKGGRTVVKILKDDEVVAEGTSFCSELDNYNRKIGRNISLGRAMRNFNVQN